MAPYQPPDGTNYSQIKLTQEEVPHIFRIMGKGGKWFKSFTQNNKLEYVWFNKERSVIGLWGRHDYIENSIPIIERRINNIMVKVGIPEEESVPDVENGLGDLSMMEV